MGAAQGEAEQISIILTGAKKNTVQISTWHSYYQFNQTTLHVNFDHSIVCFSPSINVILSNHFFRNSIIILLSTSQPIFFFILTTN